MNAPASALKLDLPTLEIKSEFTNVYVYEFKSLKKVIHFSRA